MPLNVIEVLETYQKAQRYSQEEMASHLHVSQATYNNWLNNRHKINLKHYPAISKLCDVPLQEILPSEFA